VKALIAEDDVPFREALESMVAQWGYQVVGATDGLEAWQAFQAEEPPRLAVIDWVMPRMDGLELCRQVRATPRLSGVYLLLLTARRAREDIVAGLQGGADDYVTKPVDLDELRARMRVGQRIVDLQAALAGRVRELEDALAHVKQLHGLLPICAWCKRVRDDQNYWQQVESYVSAHSDVQFSHGICPECYQKVFPPVAEKS
jgi:sigma-B regulation protein RsbU (phosphoserine phosphatase)